MTPGNKKIILWSLSIGLVLPILLFLTGATLAYLYQDEIRAHIVEEVNQTYPGQLVVGDSHIDLFEDFPRISIDLENVQFYETKNQTPEPLMAIDHLFIGIDLWGLLKKEIHIKSLHLLHGHANIVQHVNGEMNILKAFGIYESPEDKPEPENNSPLFLELKEMILKDFHFTKLNEETGLHIEIQFIKTKAGFRIKDRHLFVNLYSDCYLDVINGDEKNIFTHKHLVIEGKLDYHQEKEDLRIEQADILFQDAQFGMVGHIDFNDDMNLDLELFGNKSDFNLLLAFIPDETAEIIARYKNEGQIYFKASLNGKALNGHTPLVVAEFGCAQAYFLNAPVDRKIDELGFRGFFTNGTKRNLSTSEFHLLDFKARPGSGDFRGSFIVRNFEDPYIDMNLYADLDLDYLEKFLGLEGLKGMSGQVTVAMRFDELIDLDVPEMNFNRLKEGIDSEIKIKNLSFTLPGFPVPIRNVNASAVMKKGAVELEYLKLVYGHSDFNLSGSLNDFPALLHHQNRNVTLTMALESKHIVLKELLAFNPNLAKATDEELSHFRFKAHFETSVEALEKADPLPIGEFFIDDLFVKLKHYPHALHDFDADILIDKEKIQIIGFNGEIDQSDFHITATLHNYAKWFMPVKQGTSHIEFDLNSKQLIFSDLFQYGTTNHFPESYQHEVLTQFALKGKGTLAYDSLLKFIEVDLIKAKGKLKMHNLPVQHLSGHFHFEKDQLKVENMHLTMGQSDLFLNLDYFLGTDPKLRQKQNHLYLRAPRLDADALLAYNSPPQKHSQANAAPTDHDSSFNLFELSFQDLSLHLDIEQLNYHAMRLNALHAFVRMKENHLLYLDTFSVNLANGNINLSGYLNGSDPKHLYCKSTLHLSNLDLNKLLIKFDNLGQDIIISDQIEGILSGKIESKFNLHTDLTPILHEGEAKITIELTKGVLKKFAPMQALASYFKDKNIHMIRFDTLSNTLILKNGKLSVPAMNINTSLGFIEISGSQDLQKNMEYFVRIPMKMVTEVGFQALFGKKRNPEDLDENQIDEIERRDPKKRTRFLNLKITGTPDNYTIGLGKNKGEPS
jgi:hypothetical protein